MTIEPSHGKVVETSIVEPIKPSLVESIESSALSVLEPSDVKTSAKRRPIASRVFTGRRGILNQLEDFFDKRERGCHSRREFLMYGMGGAGKTQLSLKFAEENKDRYVWSFSKSPTII